MRSIPLFKDRLCAFERATPAHDDEPITVDKKLYAAMSPETTHDDPTGAVLVLLGSPTKVEEKSGRGASGKINRWVRSILEATGKKFVYYHVVPSLSGGNDDLAGARGHLHALVNAMSPERILCLGRDAFFCAAGIQADPRECPDGYEYTSEEVPILLLDRPSNAYNHRLRKPQFQKELVTALETNPPLPPWNGQAKLITSRPDSMAALAELREADWVAYDTETAGTPRPNMWFRRGCLAICAPGSDDAYVWDWNQLQKPLIQSTLRNFFTDPNVKLCAHNIKFDIQAEFHALGLIGDNNLIKFQEERIHADTMLWAFQLNSEYKHGLGNIGCRVGMGGHKKEMKEALDGAVYLCKKYHDIYKQTGKLPEVLQSEHWEVLQRAAMDEDFEPLRWAFLLVPHETMVRYCALDTVVCAKLCSKLEPEIREDEAHTRVWEKRLRPATLAVAQTEYWGMPFSVDKISQAAKGFQMVVDRISTELKDLGCTRDVSKPSGLSAYLYEDLGLPVIAETAKGTPKTDKDTLKDLYRKTSNPALKLIMDLSEARKLVSTYGESLAKKGRSGRVYGALWIHGARSSRMSSSNPNLQNFPSRGKLGKLVKKSFQPAPGRSVLSADFQSLEYRVCAAITEDPKMLEVFEKGLDLHMETAKLMAPMVWGIDPEECTREEHRPVAKGAGFACLFGQAAVTMAETQGITVEQAETIQAALMNSWVEVSKFIKYCEEYAKKHGKTHTKICVDGELLTAFTRQLPTVGSEDSRSERSELRSSFNTPIQGSGSYATMYALIQVYNWIVESGLDVQMLAVVHDSIVLECSDEIAVLVHDKLVELMTHEFGKVTLTVDGGLGPDYGTEYSLKDLRALKAANDQDFAQEEKLKLLGWKGDQEGRKDMEKLLREMEDYYPRVLCS